MDGDVGGDYGGFAGDGGFGEVGGMSPGDLGTALSDSPSSPAGNQSFEPSAALNQSALDSLAAPSLSFGSFFGTATSIVGAVSAIASGNPAGVMAGLNTAGNLVSSLAGSGGFAGTVSSNSSTNAADVVGGIGGAPGDNIAPPADFDTGIVRPTQAPTTQIFVSALPEVRPPADVTPIYVQTSSGNTGFDRGEKVGNFELIIKAALVGLFVFGVF